MKEFRLFGINRLIEEFINPLFVNLVKPFWGQLATMLAPMAIDMFSGDDDESAKLLNKEEIEQGQAKTQSLVDEQLGLAEDMMDPESELNQKVLNVLSQQASETGAETAGNVSKIAAQTGVTGGQATMAAQDSLNKALGGVGDTFADTLNSRLSQSMDLKNKMLVQQKGLEENLQNVDIANINAQNMQALLSGGGGGDITDLLNMGGEGGDGLMDILTGIGKGGEGFLGKFGTGGGVLANLFK